MRKQWKRLAAAGMAAVMAAGLMAGCGKKATPESLFKDMEKNSEKIESAKCNIAMKMEMSDGTDSMAVSMDMDMGVTTDPAAVYGKGEVDMSALGMDQKAEIEMYQVEEDGEQVTYTLTDGEWSRNVGSDDMDDMNLDMFEDVEDQAKLFELSKDMVEVNGKDCFELTGDMGGDTLSGMMGEEMISDLAGLDLDEEEISDIKVPCTMYIYREDILPARVTVDMSDVLGTLAGAEEAGVDISEFSIEITYLEFDSVDEIKVPEEALAAAEDDGSDDDYDWDDDEDISVGADPVEPSGELGDSWETYTVQVNDKVLTLPCSIADLEAAGLTMDTEYTPETYVVNSEEYELAWFEDGNGNSITVDMINMDAEPKELKDCLIGGISVYDYDLESGGLTVVFPGGVQIGTPVDDVLAAYGDTDDSYEGEYSNTYYWYSSTSFYDSCVVDTDVTTNAVTSMSISHYE